MTNIRVLLRAAVGNKDLRAMLHNDAGHGHELLSTGDRSAAMAFTRLPALVPELRLTSVIGAHDLSSSRGPEAMT
jgi:hypothetical protein